MCKLVLLLEVASMLYAVDAVQLSRERGVLTVYEVAAR
jgi:hypothetical protein